MLIEKIMKVKTKTKTGGCYLLTAPRRFGKTMNADMIAQFLKIEVDRDGQRITKSTREEPVRDTNNYKLFSEKIPKLGRCLKIAGESDLMDHHLGKYPVIWVNFKASSIKNEDDVISCCQSVIHKSFLHHKYLCISPKLDRDEIEMCEELSLIHI